MPSTASLSFDGVNDYASAAHHSDLNITGDLTVECWFKASSYNAAAKVLIGFSSDVGGNSPYKLRFNFNTIDFQEYTGYAQRNHTVSVAAVSTSAWHHIAATRSGRTIQFYLDGSPFGTSTTFTGSASGNNSGVRIGNGVFDNYFAGKMDEVRIWNVARTAGEIAAYYDKKAIGTETGLVVCWHLDEGSGTSSADAAGTAQNLTISGATWDVADFPTLTDATSGSNYPKSIAGTTTSSGAATKVVSRIVAGASASTGALFRALSRQLTGAVSSSSTTTKLVSRVLSGAVASASNLVASSIFARSLQGAITSTSTVSKSIVRSFAASITLAGNLLSSNSVSLLLQSSILSASTLARQTTKMLASSITSSSIISKQFYRVLDGSIASSSLVRKGIARVVNGAISLLGALSSQSATYPIVITPTERVYTISAENRSLDIQYENRELAIWL